MPAIKPDHFFVLFILILTVLLNSNPAGAVPAEELQSEIKTRQEQLTRHQKAIERLSEKERETYSRLAQAEDKLDEISSRLASQEKELASLLAREAEAAAQYEKLGRRKSATQKSLAELMENIWPIFLESQGKGLAEITKWSELDRKMTWLRIIYQEAEKRYSLLQAQSSEMATNLVKLQIMKDEYQQTLSQVNKTKDRLLDEKLKFLKELQEIR
ncbi:MAG: hypothetical protein ACLFT1_07890, partial [Desulfonatronovibrio sp.]